MPLPSGGSPHFTGSVSSVNFQNGSYISTLVTGGGTQTITIKGGTTLTLDTTVSSSFSNLAVGTPINLALLHFKPRSALQYAFLGNVTLFHLDITLNLTSPTASSFTFYLPVSTYIQNPQFNYRIHTLSMGQIFSPVAYITSGGRVYSLTFLGLTPVTQTLIPPNVYIFGNNNTTFGVPENNNASVLLTGQIDEIGVTDVVVGFSQIADNRQNRGVRRGIGRGMR